MHFFEAIRRDPKRCEAMRSDAKRYEAMRSDAKRSTNSKAKGKLGNWEGGAKAQLPTARFRQVDWQLGICAYRRNGSKAVAQPPAKTMPPSLLVADIKKNVFKV